MCLKSSARQICELYKDAFCRPFGHVLPERVAENQGLELVRVQSRAVFSVLVWKTGSHTGSSVPVNKELGAIAMRQSAKQSRGVQSL